MNEEELFDLVRNAYTEANEDYLVEQASNACKYCQNNPKNGGTGICECILGNPVQF